SGASTIHVLGNDRDADDDALAIGSFTQPQHGLLVDGGDGTLVFTPNAGFLTTDTFTYNVSDGSGAVDTATVTLVRGPAGRWDFDNPANLTAATLGNPLALVGDDLAITGIGTDDGAVRLGIGDYYIVDHDIAPNGGGSKVNEYTLVYDFQVPTVGPWACFFQTDATNASDGDCFVNPDGAIGVGQTGYSSTLIAPATWYRLAVVVDNASRYNIYLDGTKILPGVVQTVDGRFSLGQTLLVCADENGEDNTMDLSMFSIYDRALSDGEVALLGGPYQPDPENTPPAVVDTPAGPESTTTRTDVAYTFHANDADGDRVQFQIDWGDGSVTPWSAFQSSVDPYVIHHEYPIGGTMPIRANIRDEHGATSGLTLVQTIDVFGDVTAEFITMPYLQNVTDESIVIMWETDVLVPITVEYGLTDAYGSSVAAASEASGFNGTYIYKAELTGLAAQSEYHYRVMADGETALTGDRQFTTGTSEAIDFSFASWSDSQGTNHGAWSADPLEPTTSMMAHMAASGVDFAFDTGDLAESGSSYPNTRDYYLDRVAKYLGQTVPWFNAWGNHDTSSSSSIIRRFADMPSKDRSGYTPGFGSYYFTYADCLFIAIDYSDQGVITSGWLENLLKSDLNKNARFTILGTHVPPYCELWLDGNSTLRGTLVPLMEEYGVDVCISGHTHEYERGYLNGVHYVITGGGSWLDFPESLVYDWPLITVGGYHDLPASWASESSPGVLGEPQPIRGGLVNEYVTFDVTGDHLTVKMHGFNADGSYIGVLDAFAFGNTVGVNDPPLFDNVPLVASAATWAMPYSDSLAGAASDVDAGDVLSYSKTSGPDWLQVAADGTRSGLPDAGDLGRNDFVVRVTDTGGRFDETSLRISVGDPGPTVAGRHVFYNNSAFDDPGHGGTDDDAVALDKTALLPGDTATPANYTSYSRGLNGIMVDVALPTGTITAADFQFKVGNNNDPEHWALLAATPTVSVRPGEGDFGSDRVTIIFPDGAIRKQWLQVTVLAPGNTGLAAPDVFYFGNAIGESGDSLQHALVNATDALAARDNQHSPLNPAAITDAVDFNRDRLVNLTDMELVRLNATSPLTALRLIATPEAPAVEGSAVMAGEAAPTAPRPAPGPVVSPDALAAAQAAFDAAAARRERRRLAPVPRVDGRSPLLAPERVDAVMARPYGPQERGPATWW
ncbi:MAG: cadherin-like domain-containing protein, partial [Planctomycetia bacterium]|nr:cadherin-like domain-containing protein [Planctomycetia bacterium]